MATEIEAIGYIEAGRLTIERDKWPLADGTVTVLVSRYSEADARGFTLKQRRYYFGVVLREIRREIGQSTQEAHEMMKAVCLPQYDAEDNHNGTIINGLVIGGTIRKLRGEQPAEYIDECIRWAAERGIVVPDPDPELR